jgi:O-antigen biosynthesis protein
VLRLAENQGFASGVNAGVASARGDVVALLNDDAMVCPSWLDSSKGVLAAGDVAAVAPRILLARRFAEVVLDDDVHWAEGDERALGRQLTSASLDGEDVLSELVGPGIHQLEHGPTGERWRWTAGRLPFYAPISEEPQLGGSSPIRTGTSAGASTSGGAGPGTPAPVGEEPPRSNHRPLEQLELVLDGEPIPIRRIVDLVNSAGSYLRKDGYAGDCGADLPDDDRWNLRRECFAVSGAALVTTASVLARVGPFERSYFAYYEDTDWCWRARLQGYRIMYDPSCTVRHVRGQTSGGTLAGRTRFLAERNRLLTLARCAPLRLAAREAGRKWSGGGDDGVAASLVRALPAALAQRARLRRTWVVACREVYDRWAGVDVP